MKLLVLILLLTVLLAPTTNCSGQDARKKSIELGAFDLFVDGSVTPQTVNLTGFPAGSWITLIILNIHFEDNALDFDGWGAGPALTNGTAVLIDGENLLDANLTDNHGFGHLSGDLTIFTDDKNPKDNHFVSRFALWEVIPPWGLQWNNNASLQFIVQDNQTAVANAVDLFEVNVEGFSLQQFASGEEDEPDVALNEFLENQLRVIVTIAPWLLLIAFAVGIILYAKHKMKL